jgi:hypothetical protein
MIHPFLHTDMLKGLAIARNNLFYATTTKKTGKPKNATVYNFPVMKYQTPLQACQALAENKVTTKDYSLLSDAQKAKFEELVKTERLRVAKQFNRWYSPKIGKVNVKLPPKSAALFNYFTSKGSGDTQKLSPKNRAELIEAFKALDQKSRVVLQKPDVFELDKDLVKTLTKTQLDSANQQNSLKALNPWILFVTENAKGSAIGNSETRDKYKALSAEERKKLEDRVEEMKEKLKPDVEPVSPEELVAASIFKLHRKLGARAFKLMFPIPKKPLNAYSAFLSNELAASKGKLFLRQVRSGRLLLNKKRNNGSKRLSKYCLIQNRSKVFSKYLLCMYSPYFKYLACSPVIPVNMLLYMIN